MTEELKIFTEQLKGDRRQKIDTRLPPDFLDLVEKEVKTPSPVNVKAEAHILDDLLMLQLDVATDIEMPCSICNTSTIVPLQNKNILISIPLSELSTSIYDISGLVREEILLLIPQFIECKKGACPERKAINPFLKHEKKNFPFADLG